MRTKEQEHEYRANYYAKHKDSEKTRTKKWNKEHKTRKRETNAARYEKHRVATPEKPKRVIEHGVLVKRDLIKEFDPAAGMHDILDPNTNIRVFEDQPGYADLLHKQEEQARSHEHEVCTNLHED